LSNGRGGIGRQKAKVPAAQRGVGRLAIWKRVLSWGVAKKKAGTIYGRKTRRGGPGRSKGGVE